MNRLQAALLAVIGLLFIPGVIFTISDLIPLPPQIDFAAYYLAAHAIRGGEDPYDPAVLAQFAARAGIAAHTPYIYPPFLAVAIQPIAALPYPVAAVIWLAMSAAALVVALVLLRAIVDIQDRVFPLAVGAVFFLPPVHHTLELGQINHFLLLLIVAAALQTRALWSGVLIGAAAALKVFPAVFGGVFVVRKHFAGIAAAALVGAIATAASAGYGSGHKALERWVHSVSLGITGERLVTPNNQSLEAVTARFLEPHTFEAIAVSPARSTRVRLEPLVHAPGYATVVARAAAVIIILVTVGALLSSRGVPGALAQCARFAVLVAMTLIVLPVVWDHYYVLLFLPIAVLYRGGDYRLRVALLTGAILILFHSYWRLTLYARSPVLLSAGLAGVMTIWVALLAQLARPDIIRVSSKGVSS
jgi:hypothetical protein